MRFYNFQTPKKRRIQNFEFEKIEVTILIWDVPNILWTSR